MIQRILAVAAGFLVLAMLSGWGHEQHPHGAGQPDAARAIAAVTRNAPNAGRQLPADFAAVMGYRPALVPVSGRIEPTRSDGGCSSPFGGTRYHFSGDCKQHDLGYDLLRYANLKGQPLGAWARKAVDAHFSEQLQAQCGPLACQVVADGYADAVDFNSWRQGYGVPVIERLSDFIPAGLAGVATMLLLGALPVPRRRSGRSSRQDRSRGLGEFGPSRPARLRVLSGLGRIGRLAALNRVGRLPEPEVPAQSGGLVKFSGLRWSDPLILGRIRRPGRWLVAAAMLALALQPALLPHPEWVQAVIGGAAAAEGYALAALIGWLVAASGGGRGWRRLSLGSPSVEVRRRARLAALLGAPGLVVAGVLVAHPGQLRVAAQTGMTGTTLAAELLAALGALVIASVLVSAGQGVRAGVRAIWRVPRRAAAIAVVPVLVLAGCGYGAAANPASTSSESLGVKGEQFLADRPNAAQISAVTGRPALTPVRVYVGRTAAPTPAARARLAVNEIQRAGGFRRAALLINVPTGSGWVDPAATSALEYLYGGNVTTVAMQYAASPSWLAYLRGGEGVQVSARALTDAIRARLLRLPAGHRPRLLIYGESLGAWGGLRAYPDRGGMARRTDGALWVGVPGGTAHGMADGENTLMHPDDPVPAWSLRLMLRDSPAWPRRWLPIVSFWQATGDVISVPMAPEGFGHRYGAELVNAWHEVAPTGNLAGAPPPDRLGAVRRAIT
jgi:uncharacterized membrane protein